MVRCGLNWIEPDKVLLRLITNREPRYLDSRCRQALCRLIIRPESKGRESVMTNGFRPTVWVGLRALLAEIRRSPILIPSFDFAAFRREWTFVRKSGQADAFVLAWLASERNAARRPTLM